MEKKQAWLKKWLRVKAHCAELVKLEDEMYRFCSDIAKAPSKGRTIVIYGANGSGKTHCAKAVARWMRFAARAMPTVLRDDAMAFADVSFVNWPAVVDGFKKGNWNIVDDLIESTVTILDDIGAEHDPSKIGVEKIYRILSERESKFNLITTNIVPAEWQEKFELRVASRLFRNATHIDLTKVPDYGATF